jgi:signal transduction histidine kinase
MNAEDNVTLLLIDDKEANIFALENILEKPGRVLLSATSGQEGLKLALDNNVDLIILDVQMPEMDGFEVAQILKSHGRTRDIPIIFASAEKKERHSVMKGFEEGAVDYLSKPLDPELTKAKVSVLVKLQLQKKELIEKNINLQKAETEIKRLNSDLNSNLVQLEAMNRELESFSYSVSHDLRAPLRSVIGFSQILKEDCAEKLTAEESSTLNKIVKNANRMNTLIEDLLEFSKSIKKDLTKSDVDHNQIVQRVFDELSSALTNQPVLELVKLPTSSADKALMTQVWVNLISNAIKYTGKNPAPRIEVGGEVGEGEVTYYIKDNGVGFDMDYAGKLFGVFQRLHKSNEFEGTGVGLALVQRIIFRHGGRVSAEGKLNKGATFRFSLPDK